MSNPADGSTRVIAQAAPQTVISEFAVSPDGAYVAYTLQALDSLHRQVRIGSTADPRAYVDVPQDQPWNDRVVAWSPGG